MTILREPTIPGEFIRMDTRVTATDQFANVRDAQTARENMNILIARRLRHPLISVRFKAANTTTAGPSIKGVGALGAMGGPGEGAVVLGPWRVRVPPFCRWLTFRLRASAGSASGDVLVHPALSRTSGESTQPSPAYVITVTGTALAEYELDVPVAVSYSGAARLVDVYLFFSCESYGAPQKGSNVTVAWAEARAVIGTTTISGGVGDLLFFTSPSDQIDPQAIVGITSITVDGSTYERIEVEQPFSIAPVAGDTYNTYAVSAIVPVTLTVIPKAISDFNAPIGLT